MEKPLKKKNTHSAGQSGKGTFTNIPKRKNKLRKNERKSSVSQKANEMVFSLFK
jgi:hypothetical protein